MGVNKVVFGAVAIMDISDSTVTPETLGNGVIAYDKTGERITGKLKKETETWVLTLEDGSTVTKAVYVG